MNNQNINPGSDLVAMVVISLVFILICLFIIIFVLKKLYLRQRFTEHGSGLHHLGFKGKRPFDALLKLLINRPPVYDIRLGDWRYHIHDTDYGIRIATGIDIYDRVVFVGAILISKYPVIANIIGRTPHHERESDGSFMALLPDHKDQIIKFYCPFYRLYHHVRLPAKALIRLSLVPYFVRVFENEESIKNFKVLKSKKSSDAITGYSRSIFDIVDFLGKPMPASIPAIYACGEVMDHRKMINSLTKKAFHVTTIDTGSAMIDIIGRRRTFWRLPRQGEFIAVNGQTTGYIERIIE